MPEREPPAVSVEAQDDRELRRELTRRLDAVDGLATVQVEVEAGIVTLTGEVLTPSLAGEAADLVQRSEGVVEVIDEISVTRDPRRIVGPVVRELLGRAQSFLAWLPLLGVALVLVGVFALLAGWLGRRDALYRRITDNRFLQDLWRQLVRAGVFVAGLLIALELLDATALVGAVLGTAGVVGLALGFAFRDVAENFIAGLLLSVRQPFLPNDHVLVDGEEGKVLRLTPRATILVTLDGNHLRIPNAKVFKAVLVNYSRNPRRRFSVDVGIGTDEDLLLAQNLGVETLRAIDGVMSDPEPSALIVELGDSSVVVRYFAWVDQREHSFGAVRSEAMRQLKMCLEEAGMDLPEPIYRLRIASKEGLWEPLAPAGSKRPEAAAESPAREGGLAPSTKADGVIDAQIEVERRDGAADLLTETAPLE